MQASHSFADNEWMVLIGVILIVLQFLYRHWDKKDNAAVLNALAEAIKSYEPHIELGKRTHGTILELKKLHDIRDDDGRPIWYMPKEIIQTQRELVELIHRIADTEAQMCKLLDRIESKMEIQRESCNAKFTTLARHFKEDT